MNKLHKFYCDFGGGTNSTIEFSDRKKGNMQPDATYTKLQRELRTLIEHGDHSGRRRKINKQLESRFMAAWHFTPDRRRLGARLQGELRNRLIDGGFDHCTYYTGAYDQRVIVTQPYGDRETELRSGLKLEDGTSPEIVAAGEWAFYYPGRAALIILKFPFGYADKLK